MGMTEDLHRQLINDLLIESAEGLDRFDQYLLELEKGEGGAETLNGIFRVIHTIKGTSGSIGFSRIEKLAHAGENLLSLLREGRVQAHPAMITTLLRLSDALREMLRLVESAGHDGDDEYDDLRASLERLQDPSAAEPPAADDEGWGALEPAAAAGTSSPLALEIVDDDDDAAPAAPPALSVVERPAVAGTPAAASATAAPAKGGSVAESAIRVDVGQLDKLMNLVGELVLARNQIIQHSSAVTEDGLVKASQRLNVITTELQESVMKTRMQPIGNVWSKFPRIVRDLASELGKDVQLVMEGEETELDRTIIEAIKDPLTHIVRNSVDHGFESPSQRRGSGKPVQGTLLMRAFHEGGQVNIEIVDDGRGIAVEKVVEKAVQRGLLTADRAARLTDREAFQLIFAPGFSTAEKVTNVSGRGVGMDVVRTNIEKIGGSVDVSSDAGRGTTIRIKIPLTLAIIPALIVTSGGDRFAIPQVSLLELVRLSGESSQRGIESVYDQPVFRLRGSLLPLVCLNRELKLGAETDLSENVNIVVLQAEGRAFGLIVDAVNDTEEIVVKPLGKQLKGVTHFAGATIMGDGRVALILDVLGLATRANVVSKAHERGLVQDEAEHAVAARDAAETLLIFGVGPKGRMAVPLSTVARLEEFPASQVERSGGQSVVQYRGQLLPLVMVEQFVPGGNPDAEPHDPMQVVVASHAGRQVGLVVDHIEDIVQTVVRVRRATRADGVAGSIVVNDRVTDLLDVGAVVRAARIECDEPAPLARAA